jgi:hypothetical protein
MFYLYKEHEDSFATYVNKDFKKMVFIPKKSIFTNKNITFIPRQFLPVSIARSTGSRTSIPVSPGTPYIC